MTRIQKGSNMSLPFVLLLRIENSNSIQSLFPWKKERYACRRLSSILCNRGHSEARRGTWKHDIPRTTNTWEKNFATFSYCTTTAIVLGQSGGVAPQSVLVYCMQGPDQSGAEHCSQERRQMRCMDPNWIGVLYDMISAALSLLRTYARPPARLSVFLISRCVRSYRGKEGHVEKLETEQERNRPQPTSVHIRERKRNENERGRNPSAFFFLLSLAEGM